MARAVCRIALRYHLPSAFSGKAKPGGSLRQQLGGGEQQREAHDVDEREHGEEMPRAGVRFLQIEAKRDQAGKRGHRRAEPSDVDAGKQPLPVAGKAGEQDCRRHVADALAGNGGGEQRVARQQRFEQRAYGRDAAEVAGEDEEAAEGEQQVVIDAPEQRPVRQQQEQQRRAGGRDVMHKAEHCGKAQQEQRDIGGEPPAVRNARRLRKRYVDPAAGRGGPQRRRRKRDEAQEGERQHRTEELPGPERIARIQIEVLRIADGRGHAAKVGRHGLQRAHAHGQRLRLRLAQQEEGERHERDERHVVCHQHGHEERQQHQQQAQRPERAFPGEQALCEQVEQAAPHKSLHDRHQREQQAQYAQINIGKIRRIRRHEQRGEQRRDESDAQYRFGARPAQDG